MTAATGYKQAIETLLDVARRTGSPAAQWAAEYLAEDPDQRAPAERCWHDDHCSGTGPECEPDDHSACVEAWHANHGCASEPADLVHIPREDA